MGNYLTKPSTTENIHVVPNRKYGHIKGCERPTDLYHEFAVSPHLQSVKGVDLRNFCPPVYDQGQLGSCTANAIAGAYEIDEIIQKEENAFTPSRLFIYYNERDMEGNVDTDSGAEIHDGIKSIHDLGICPETIWDYDITKFAEKPPTECYTDAKLHVTIDYKRVRQSLDQLKSALVAGYPVVFGFSVYDSFESDAVAKTGMVPMPDTEKETLLSGHAVLCVGYDADKEHFIVRNSWSDAWGDKGYCYFPFAYLTDHTLSSDFWTVKKVSKNVVVAEPIQIELDLDPNVTIRSECPSID
jgi:C1A family cysteine protease